MGPDNMSRNLLLTLTLTLAFGISALGPVTDVADACPMCQIANESDTHKPRAYMYSILFMLSMPMMVFAGFGFGLYRLSQREQRDVDAAQLNTDHDRA